MKLISKILILVILTALTAVTAKKTETGGIKSKLRRLKNSVRNLASKKSDDKPKKKAKKTDTNLISYVDELLSSMSETEQSISKESLVKLSSFVSDIKKDNATPDSSDQVKEVMLEFRDLLYLMHNIDNEKDLNEYLKDKDLGFTYKEGIMILDSNLNLKRKKSFK